MKKWLFLLFCVSLFGICLLYNDEIVTYVVEAFASINEKPTILKNNEYAQNNNYKFVEITDNFSPTNRQDIINIYYTVLNSGMDTFTFYCPKEYKTCIDDIDFISNDQTLLSNINNFVPVYNNFSNIETSFDTLGKVTIYITHNYNQELIEILNSEIKKIIAENITLDMSDENKIKVLHDYIINNTSYDIDRSDKKIVIYQSDNAYGALIEHYAICGGYADSMKLLLDELNIPNYKISSENHIWNLVYVNDNWYHLDLTWDDPVTSSGDNILVYDYFLITTDELHETNSDQHAFNNNIYLETQN